MSTAGSLSLIALQRLVSQQIAESQLPNPTAVVSWLGAVQAQDYPGAKWSLGLRLNTSATRDSDIESALNSGTIFRTWAMRGTLHLVTASDIHWLLHLLAPRIIASCARRYRELDLDEPTFARSNVILVEALTNKPSLNRTALMAVLEKDGIATTGQRAPYLLQRASLDRLIVQSVTIKNDPTYQLLPPLASSYHFDRVTALAELTQRYFLSRSPATIADFSWWSGLPIADVKRGMADLGAELIEEPIDGQRYWRHRDSPVRQNDSSRAYLLPGFDEYLLSYKDRSAMLDWPRLKVDTPNNGMLPSTMVDGTGHVIGLWRRTLQKNSVTVTFSPYSPLTKDQEQSFAEAAARYGQFLGLPVQIT